MNGSLGGGSAADLPAAVAAALAALAPCSAAAGPWQSGALAALAHGGVLAEFVPADVGGRGAAEPRLVAILAAVAERCLTTALVLSQWAAAVRTIAAGPAAARAALLPPLARGETFTTVGISQLTTSQRHVGVPVLVAGAAGDGWRLDGLCPWVTGADACDTIVTGAACADGGQAFFVVSARAPGLVVEPPLKMLALGGSRTARVRLAGVRADWRIDPGPGGPRTGGLATSALALGASRAAVAVIAAEAAARPALGAVVTGLSAEADALADRLAAAARDGLEPADRDRLRTDANGLVLRAAQAALTACKGAGFVSGHPAERLVREAHFFLVWSCPQAVSDAMLCELAGP